MAGPYVLHRWTAVALVSVAGLLVLAYLVAPDWSTQYAAWLTIFTIWMVWFVHVARKWIADADF